MKDFTLPNYNGGSIVNLMASIEKSFGLKTTYPILKLLPPEKLKDSKNVVLLILDGLGYEYLKKKKKMPILNNYLLGSMTSVFLPTTASAITTFLTAVAPQQHALTGWFIHLKEIGVVSTILPFSPRYGKTSFSKEGIEINDILGLNPLSSRIKSQTFCITHERIAYSDFNIIG